MKPHRTTPQMDIADSLGQAKKAKERNPFSFKHFAPAEEEEAPPRAASTRSVGPIPGAAAPQPSQSAGTGESSSSMPSVAKRHNPSPSIINNNSRGEEARGGRKSNPFSFNRFMSDDIPSSAAAENGRTSVPAAPVPSNPPPSRRQHTSELESRTSAPADWSDDDVFTSDEEEHHPASSRLASSSAAAAAPLKSKQQGPPPPAAAPPAPAPPAAVASEVVLMRQQWQSDMARQQEMHRKEVDQLQSQIEALTRQNQQLSEQIVAADWTASTCVQAMETMLQESASAFQVLGRQSAVALDIQKRLKHLRTLSKMDEGDD